MILKACEEFNLCLRDSIFLGDNVTARIEITNINKDEKVINFKTYCLVKNRIMIDGSAEIFIP